MSAPQDVITELRGSDLGGGWRRGTALPADDAVIVLPGGDALEGKEGARQFAAAKHAEIDGQKRSVTLTSLEARTPDRFLATLEMSSRAVAADEPLYSFDVGSVYRLAR
jgi:uncharacterized protein (DUF2345 family)